MNKFLVIILLVVTFYLVFVIYSDFSKVSKNIEQFKFELLPVMLVLTSCGIIMRGLRQRILLNKIGIKISLKENLLLYLSGLSMVITPGGSGELIKNYYLKKKFGYKITKTLPLVPVERFFDLIAMLTLISFTLLFIQIPAVVILDGTIIALAVLVYAAFRSRNFFNIIKRILIKIPRLNKRIENIAESYDGFRAMTSKKTTIKNWILSIMAAVFDAIAIYFIFIAFNIELEIIFTTLVTFSSFLIGAVSFLPSGIGITEISFLQFLTEEGLEISLATSIIIMVRVITIWFSTIIGLISTKLFIRK